MAFEVPEPYGGSAYHLTAEQVRELAWRVAGATMAAIGTPHADLARLGKLLEPTLEALIRDYLVVVTER